MCLYYFLCDWFNMQVLRWNVLFSSLKVYTHLKLATNNTLIFLLFLFFFSFHFILYSPIVLIYLFFFFQQFLFISSFLFYITFSLHDSYVVLLFLFALMQFLYADTHTQLHALIWLMIDVNSSFLYYYRSIWVFIFIFR